MTTNESQISIIIENWAKSVREKNIDGIMARHSANILLFDVPEPFQSNGTAEYRASWEDVFFPWYGDDGRFDVSDLQINAGDDVAFCTAVIHCAGTEKGQKISLKVRLTVGLKKIAGEWTVTHEHHSLPAL